MLQMNLYLFFFFFTLKRWRGTLQMNLYLFYCFFSLWRDDVARCRWICIVLLFFSLWRNEVAHCRWIGMWLTCWVFTDHAICGDLLWSKDRLDVADWSSVVYTMIYCCRDTTWLKAWCVSLGWCDRLKQCLSVMCFTRWAIVAETPPGSRLDVYRIDDVTDWSSVWVWCVLHGELLLQRHHLAQSMCILNTEGSNIFENLSSRV